MKTQIFPVIPLNGFLYVVDKAHNYPKVGDYFYRGYYPPTGNYKAEVTKVTGTNTTTASEWYKIIASNDPSIDVPKLPKMQEDKEIFVVMNPKGGNGPMYHTYRVKGFEDLEDAKEFCKEHPHLEIVSEWIKTSSKKQYSKEEMIKAMKFAWTCGLDKRESKIDWYISTTRPTLKEVKLEIEPFNIKNDKKEYCAIGFDDLTSISDLQWEPKIDENGFVTVKQWLYD